MLLLEQKFLLISEPYVQLMMATENMHVYFYSVIAIKNLQLYQSVLLLILAMDTKFMELNERRFRPMYDEPILTPEMEEELSNGKGDDDDE